MKLQKKIRNSFFLLLFLALPGSVFASVQITEIMYDLEGADSGYEWIEVTNTGIEAVDIGKWRLFEGNTNHKLEPTRAGTTVLAAGASAIIADKPTNFMSHWPDVSLVFDSAFSLSNTGETLALKNDKLEVVTQFSYTADMGATGDSGSLHVKDGTWVAALPNPGIFPGELRIVQKKQIAPAATAKPKSSPVKKVTETASASDSEPAKLSNAAAVAATPPSGLLALLPWLLGLGSIISIGVAGALLAKAERGKEGTLSPADEFEIVEN